MCGGCLLLFNITSAAAVAAAAAPPTKHTHAHILRHIHEILYCGILICTIFNMLIAVRCGFLCVWHIFHTKCYHYYECARLLRTINSLPFNMLQDMLQHFTSTSMLFSFVVVGVLLWFLFSYRVPYCLGIVVAAAVALSLWVEIYPLKIVRLFSKRFYADPKYVWMCLFFIMFWIVLN